jgi:hypothetical protein
MWEFETRKRRIETSCRTQRAPLYQQSIRLQVGSLSVSPSHTAHGQLRSFRKENIDLDTSAACSLSCRRPTPRRGGPTAGTACKAHIQMSFQARVILHVLYLYRRLPIHTARHIRGRNVERFMCKRKIRLSWTFILSYKCRIRLSPLCLI